MRRPYGVRSRVSRVRRRVARVTNAVPRARKDDAGARATRAHHRDARADASGPAPQIAKRSARVVEREKMKRESDAGEQRRAGTRDVTRLGRARGALAHITRDDRHRFATVRPAGRRARVSQKAITPRKCAEFLGWRVPVGRRSRRSTAPSFVERRSAFRVASIA